MALAGALMALLRRQTTGKGDYIDVAMMDALIASLPNGYGLPMTERRQPVARHERTWGGNAMYRVYETKDGRFVVLGGAEIEIRDQPVDGARPARSDPACASCRRARARTRCATSDRDLPEPNPGRMGGLDGGQGHRVRARQDAARGARRSAGPPPRMVVEDRRGWKHLGIPIKFSNEPGEIGSSARARRALRRDPARLGYSDAELAAMKAEASTERPSLAAHVKARLGVLITLAAMLGMSLPAGTIPSIERFADLDVGADTVRDAPELAPILKACLFGLPSDPLPAISPRTFALAMRGAVYPWAVARSPPSLQGQGPYHRLRLKTNSSYARCRPAVPDFYPSRPRRSGHTRAPERASSRRRHRARAFA